MSSEAPAPRYAIYFVPAAETALYRFGSAVLGYDAYTGDNVPLPATAAPDWSDRIREPRVYGFHATLKPPFRLADGTSFADLTAAFDAFATSQSTIEAGPLQVRAIGAFIALMPAAPCPPLDRLAGACVRHFDRFRAPLTERERERRLAAPLTERQTGNLERWGYPYVLDDFRFHMTLTGPLADDDRARAFQWLTAAFASHADAQRLVLDRLVIARQDGGGAFRAAHSAPMGA
jgi:putative phosphonate metabolism protein